MSICCFFHFFFACFCINFLRRRIYFLNLCPRLELVGVTAAAANIVNEKNTQKRQQMDGVLS